MKNLLRVVLGCLLAIMLLAAAADAQTVQPVCSFTNGALPTAGLTLGPDGNFYGTTYGSSTGGDGTVYRVSTNGGFATLATFAYTNGAYPYAGLAPGPDGNFYGTSQYGGTNGYGTVFEVTTNGALTTVATFAGLNGANPLGGLTLGPDHSFYGTTYNGGSGNAGTVFRVTTNGVLTTLVSFTFFGLTGYNPRGTLTLGQDGKFYGTTSSGASGSLFQVTTNGTITPFATFGGAEGSPYAGVTLGPDGNFYGTTLNGGSLDDGSVFRVYSYGGGPWVIATFTSANGADPVANLALGPDGSFYGTTEKGGNGNGTVFRVTTAGSLTTLANFTSANGANPYAGLTLGSDGKFYGTTQQGGAGNDGTVFRITTNGVLTTLLSFAAASGPANSFAGLTLGLDGNLYGTSSTGGTANDGTVFRATTNGALTTLVNFNSTNGAYPNAGLTLGPDGNFYGTTAAGGNDNDGIVFRMTTNGTLTTLVTFTAANGAEPYASLTLGRDGNFYGTTLSGGASDNGTVFRLTTNGILTTLVSFSFNVTNGLAPYAGLMLGPDGNFYGTTQSGGSSYDGTVFRVTTNGTLTTLATFTLANGAVPYANLTLGADGNFYGTTASGGSSGYGTAFRVTTNGTLTTLVNFNNTNGVNPEAALVPGADGYFYGTTSFGGSGNNGTVFRMSTNGTLTTLVRFSPANGVRPDGGLVLAPDGNFYGTTEQGGSGGGGNIYRLSVPAFQAYAASPTSGMAPLAVNFTSTNADSAGNAITQWNWTFGDGGTSTLQNPTHIYGTGGSFTPALVVVNSNGLTLAASGPAIATYLPTVQFTASPVNGFAPLAVQFNSTNFDSAGNGISQWNWNFGDNLTSTLENPLHLYASSGVFTPSLTVTNTAGAVITATGPAITAYSPPKFLAITGTNGSYQFSWNALSTNPAVGFQLQYTTNLAAPNWLNLGGFLPGLNPVVTLTDTLPADRQRFYRLKALPGATVFQDTFNPQTGTGIGISSAGGDVATPSVAVVSGAGAAGSAALEIECSATNGPSGGAYLAGQWQDAGVTGNSDPNLSDYYLSFDACVTGDASHHSGGGFSLTIQEGAGNSFSAPFPQGQLQTYLASQGGSDLLLPQSGAWRHFTINLGGPTFQSPYGTNSTFNPAGSSWAVIFQLNSADWGGEPQTNSTLLIDNLGLMVVTRP